jgi:hypothetical protein
MRRILWSPRGGNRNRIKIKIKIRIKIRIKRGRLVEAEEDVKVGADGAVGGFDAVDFLPTG